MAALRTSLCAVFMVTVALCKPVRLSDDEDSNSSESRESNSSEESAAHVGPSQEPLQPASTETDAPGTAALPPSATAGPSPTTLHTSAPPDPEDPQTSTDTAAGDDPSHTTLGVEISEDAPDSKPAQDSINSDTVSALPDTEVSPNPGLYEADVIKGTEGANQPQVTTNTTTTTTYQGFPPGATPSFPPLNINPTPPPFSTAPPLIIPVETALTGVPVCFTFRFAIPEPDPPRGDSV